MRGIVEFVTSLRLLSLLGLLTLATGCASMCDSSHDCDFHAFGGMRDRHDRVNGRVGSIFDPASAQPSIVPPQEELPYVRDRLDINGDDEEEGGDESDDDDGGDLEKRLIDELEGLDDLPDLPEADPDEVGTEV